MKKVIVIGILCFILVGCNKSRDKKENIAVVTDQEDIDVDQPTIYSYPLDYILTDWYDGAGNLVWKGISIDERNSLSAKQKKNFLAWWEEYDNSFYDTNSDELLNVSRSVLPREKISLLCREYNNLIPFAVDGREYGLGYEKYNDGFDNRTWKKNFGVSFGLDGEGYIIWIYRNTFGSTPDGMEDGISTLVGKRDVKQIKIEELEIGDICMLTNDTAASYNQYGIVAGENDGNIVVSLCDNVSTPKFSDGGTRLAYIVDDYNVAIGESMPVDFKYFIRLTDLDWGE